MSNAKQAVFDLLEREGFTSQSKWEDASANTAYREFVTGSAGERKQLFAEFLNFIRNKERDEKRKRVQSARVDFQTALDSWVTADNINTLTFPKAAEQFHLHSFWPLLSEDELDEIYQSFLDDFERSSRDLINDSRKTRTSNLAEVLSQDERFNADTPFEKIVPLFPGNSKLELLLSWEKFVDASDRSETARNRQLRQKKERRARLAFRSVLSNLQGKPWPEVHAEVKDRDCYIELIGSRGSQPYDLYLALGGPAHRSRSRSASIESLD